MTEPDYLPWMLAKRHGVAPALADETTSLSFAELDERTEAVAAQLAARGFRAGDVLALLLPNRVELVVAMFAAWRLGGVVTPMNPALTSAEANYQILDSGTSIVIAHADAPAVDAEVLFVEQLADRASSPVPPAPVRREDLALLVYTSGSTGRPKGVMLTHANIEAMTATMVTHFRLTAADHCLLILPLFHVNALMVSTLSPLRVGGRLSMVRAFSTSSFFDTVERLRPTFFSAVPTIYALLAALPPEVAPDTSSLRFVVCGAAPVTRELLRACEQRYGFVMVEGYGLTEGTCASACNPLDGVRKLGTVGPALPGQRIAIVGPQGTPLPAGATGEIAISGPTVMTGYLGRPDETALVRMGQWLLTGDVGRLDEDGYLQVLDRVKDMIIRGGENLYPKEIESALAEADGVLEVAVVGRPDEILGEVPVAYVVPYPGAEPDPENLLEHCRARLTRAKVPVTINVVDALPRNPVGKVDKSALRCRLG